MTGKEIAQLIYPIYKEHIQFGKQPIGGLYNKIGKIIDENHQTTNDSATHKIMTKEEYTDLNIIGWHEVNKNVDSYGNYGIKYKSRA